MKRKGRKGKRRALCFFAMAAILALFFAVPAYAAEEEEFLSELRALLPPSLRTEDTESLLSAVGVRGLFAQVVAVLSGQRSEILSFLLLCFGSAILICAAAHATVDTSLGSLSESLAAAVMGIAVFEPLRACTLGAVEVLSEAAAFFGAATPILQGITLAGGGVQSATAGALGAQITISVVTLFFSEIVTPVVSVIFALGLVSTLGEDGASLSLLAASVRRLFLWLLGIGTTLLGSALSLQTVLAAGADTAAMRTAKYAAAGLLPLVGGAVSASLSTLATGLSFVKATAGVSVVAALLLLCIPLLVQLLLYRFCLDLSAGFSEFLGIRAAARLFATFRSAMDALIAVCALGTVLFLLQSILFLHAGVSVL